MMCLSNVIFMTRNQNDLFHILYAKEKVNSGCFIWCGKLLINNHVDNHPMLSVELGMQYVPFIVIECVNRSFAAIYLCYHVKYLAYNCKN